MNRFYSVTEVRQHRHVNLILNGRLDFLLKKNDIFYFISLGKELNPQYLNYETNDMIFKDKKLFPF